MPWIFLILLLTACGRGDDAADWTGAVETLPSGALRVSNPPAGLWTEATAWRLAPELALGRIEGDEAEVFGAIVGVEVDDRGRIYVLDRQANELRVFTPDGGHVRTVGRSGGGPGEYSAANGLLWLAPHTLLVVDQRGNRYTVLTREGEVVRTVPRELGFYAWAAQVAYDDGRVYERSTVGPTIDDRRPALLGRSVRPEAAPTDDAVALAGEGGVALEPATDTVLLPITDAPMYESFSVRTERAGMVMPVPFAPEAVYRPDGRGGLWHGHGGEPRLRYSTLDGDTLMEILFQAERAAVTPEELDEWQASEFIRRFRDLGGKIDMARIPEAKPYFDDVYRAPDDHLWVSVPSAPYEVLFRIFDPAGRYLGELRIEGMERVPNIPPVVRNGRLHFVGRDELDVPRVYVFRIAR